MTKLITAADELLIVAQLEEDWGYERFARQYGYWRSRVIKVIYEYLDCGDLRNGFARIRCKDCGHEYLLPFSCKRRHFCPSCHERQVLEFGEFLVSEVFADVPHRQWVFSIPKMLRLWSGLLVTSSAVPFP